MLWICIMELLNNNFLYSVNKKRLFAYLLTSLCSSCLFPTVSVGSLSEVDRGRMVRKMLVL